MDGEDGRFAVAEPRIFGQQGVLDDHAAFGRGVRAVVDGAEGHLSAGAAVHGVQIVQQPFHGLIGVLVRLGDGLVDDMIGLGRRQALREFAAHEGETFLIKNGTEGGVFPRGEGMGAQSGLHIVAEVLRRVAHVESEVDVLDEAAGHAGSETVLEVGNALSAVLVVLVGLYGDAGQGACALDAVGFAQEAVTGVETAVEQLLDVDLAAGRGQRQEIKVVDMDVAFLVGAAELGREQIILVEGLGRLAAVAEHGAHGGVAVDVGVFALEVQLLGVGEGKILQRVHEAGLHFAHAGALVAVENVRLGRAGVPGFDEDLFHQVLHMLHVRGVVALGFEHVEHLIGQVAGHGAVGAALSFCRTKDRLIYLGYVERNHARISFLDEADHTFSKSSEAFILTGARECAECSAL